MGFSKLTNVSLTNQMVMQIEDMIISEELKVGDKLPSARELCEMMGVSRPVVSAAMVELAKLGFVEIRPRQGAYVSDYLRKGTVETLAAVMRYRKGVMRKDEIADLIQVREILECLCVKRVIETATEEQLEELRPFVDAVRAKTPEAAAEAMFTFHHELAVLSGNMLLPLLYYSFKQQSVALWAVSCRVTGIEEHYGQKLRLYEALLRRDVKGAEELVHMGIFHATKQMFANM